MVRVGFLFTGSIYTASIGLNKNFKPKTLVNLYARLTCTLQFMVTLQYKIKVLNALQLENVASNGVAAHPRVYLWLEWGDI